jgi:hypothetical protein
MLKNLFLVKTLKCSRYLSCVIEYRFFQAVDKIQLQIPRNNATNKVSRPEKLVNVAAKKNWQIDNDGRDDDKN